MFSSQQIRQSHKPLRVILTREEERKKKRKFVVVFFLNQTLGLIRFVSSADGMFTSK